MRTEYHSVSIRLTALEYQELCSIVQLRNDATPNRDNRMSMAGVVKQVAINWLISNRDKVNKPFPPKVFNPIHHDI